MAEDKEGKNLFSKHLFKSGCTCPTKLYYKASETIYPEREQSPFLAHVQFNKQQLKSLLETFYKEGIRVAWKGYRDTAETTTRYLERERVVLFDSAFIYNRHFAKIPILEKDGNNIRIFLIQSKAFKPNRHSITDINGRIHSKWKNYIIDLSYRLYVIKQQYPDWKLESFLVLPDKSKVAQTDRLDQRLARNENVPGQEVSNLLAFIPVQQYVKYLWNGRESLFDERISHPLKGKTFEEILHHMAGWYFNRGKIFSGVGMKCSTCEFRVEKDSIGKDQISGFKECWREILQDEVDEPHIFDLIGAGNKRLMEQGIYLQNNIPFEEGITPQQVIESEGKITDLHRRILQLGKNRQQDIPRELVKPGLFKELQRWEFPLHFIDFEAGSFAIPIRANRKPYHLVVFQYSCHTLYEDGSLKHHEWIHTERDSYPNYQLINSLEQVPDILNGTIIQYSGFERGALKRIKNELEEEAGMAENAAELIAWADTIIRRDDSNGTRPPFLADLSRLVKHYYYNIEMEDSLSIKDVLRSVMEISPVLKERFTRPYSSKNFDDIIWWQQQDGRLRNPYEILRDHQPVSVGRGTEAMVTYSRLRTGTYAEGEFESLLAGLSSYCELDTLAMVMIYLHWKELME